MSAGGPSRIKDPARLRAVRATGLLDTGAEDAFDDLAQLAGTLLDAPFAFVTLVDERRSFWKSCIGVETDDLALRQNPVEESFCQYVVNSGEPLIVGDVTQNPVTAGNPSIESMGVAAWAGFPLMSPDEFVLGTFCVVDTVVREWTRRDIDVLRVLSSAAARELAFRNEAARARQALSDRDEANKKLGQLTERLQDANRRIRQTAQHDRGASRALQDAMLPRLPQPEHLEIAARYLTAETTDQVGGDWYDAVLAPDGATTLIIGDVSGHDIAAATVMGQLRSMLRAFAWDRAGELSSQLISRLDRAMAGLDIATMTTLAIVRVEQTSDDRAAAVRTVRWSSAGHPAPVIIDAAGRVHPLEGHSDPPLAVDPAWPRHDHVQRIPAGSTLVLYSDGLLETRQLDIDTRLRELQRVLAEHHHEPLHRLLDLAIAHMVGDVPDDDVAVLAVRFAPAVPPGPAN
ncbi:MAG: PP2C family protein-serine/threonine phosphatase [Jatrophihabitantaceae bacterium]